MTVTTARPTSDELIERWIRGDRQAAEELFARYYKRAWKFGLAITHQEVEAEELAHQALAHGLDVVRDPRKRPRKFTGWLLGVVKYLSWTQARRRGDPLPVELSMEDTRHGRPSGAALNSEMSALLVRAMSSLPPGDRALIEHRVLRGLTRAQAAQKLGCSIDTIDRRLKMAMARLRVFLSGHFTTMILAGEAPSMEQVMRLRPSFRAAFLARHVEGLTMEKAAAKLGIPVATLEERLQYAYECLGCSALTDFAALRRPV